MMSEFIVVGLILAIIFYEVTDVSPGGIIVPGMMAYYYYDPERIIATLFISIITFLLIKLLSNYSILYGKRKYTVTLLVAVLIAFTTNLIYSNFTINFFDIAIVGYIIPGIIANEFSKQGIFKTLLGLVIVSGMTLLVMMLL